MRRCVWNLYSNIILADNCGCGVTCHCGMSRGHCCILETTFCRVFWQLTTPLMWLINYKICGPLCTSNWLLYYWDSVCDRQKTKLSSSNRWADRLDLTRVNWNRILQRKINLWCSFKRQLGKKNICVWSHIRVTYDVVTLYSPGWCNTPLYMRIDLTCYFFFRHII